MRDTVYCQIPDGTGPETRQAIAASVREMAAAVAAYVPGYRLRGAPQFEPATATAPARVAVLLEVEGAGDFLPPYAGNLDIMTAAATRVGEGFAARITALAGKGAQR